MLPEQSIALRAGGRPSVTLWRPAAATIAGAVFAAPLATVRKSACRCSQRALLTPQTNPGSLYRRGKSA